MIDPKLQKMIQKNIQFPTLPAIALKILSVVNQENSGLAQLGEVIAVDPALSAKLLKVANSSLFGCPAEIKNIARALSILGTNTVKSIALSFVLAKNLNQGNAAFSIELFWRRAVTAAVAAEMLSKQSGRRDEDIFLMALLQDLGMLATLLTKGEEYAALLQSERDLGADLVQLERDQYGFDHQQIGWAVFRAWNLPESFSLPILYHHHPEAAPESCREEAGILALAARLAAICTGIEIAEAARLVQEELVVNFNFERHQALEFLDSVAEQSREVIALFELDPQHIQAYSQILQQANSELEKLNLGNAQIILELQESRNRVQRLVRKLAEANSQLKELVYYDGLTGLYNHRYFHESLVNELARASRYQSSLSLVMFDIDDFKKVNDLHGHPGGDLVLKNIAQAVRGITRANDILARYGGDEFAIILTSTSTEGLTVFTKHLRLCIEGALTEIKGQRVLVTVSIGAVAVTPGYVGATKEKLIEAADRGIYLSKGNGRNQVTITRIED
jgi:diguanylate cyclase (GGDEF)-like protein